MFLNGNTEIIPCSQLLCCTTTCTREPQSIWVTLASMRTPRGCGKPLPGSDSDPTAAHDATQLVLKITQYTKCPHGTFYYKTCAFQNLYRFNIRNIFNATYALYMYLTRIVFKKHIPYKISFQCRKYCAKIWYGILKQQGQNVSSGSYCC